MTPTTSSAATTGKTKTQLIRRRSTSRQRKAPDRFAETIQTQAATKSKKGKKQDITTAAVATAAASPAKKNSTPTKKPQPKPQTEKKQAIPTKAKKRANAQSFSIYPRA